ncbi:MAG: DUF2254 domain-containing protein [Rhodocyclaceae bacterium]|nr:DUF2254 domain-containing protein [Rhodocyclaceae bacterium]
MRLPLEALPVRLSTLWDRLRTSYWFVPTLMLVAAALAAWLAIYADTRVDLRRMSGLAWALVASSEGATAVMSTVAGSMVTIAGVMVFSITLVALSLASNQFGPRMLRNFIRDRVNQSALGAFLATFLYCLLVLSAIRHGPEGTEFVPRLAVGVGVLLAVASVATLIAYIHHVAVTIQADTLIQVIHADLCALMDALYPPAAGAATADGAVDTAIRHRFDASPGRVAAPCDGYLQAVDHGALASAAADADVVLRLDRAAGHHVLPGSVLMSVWPGTRLDGPLEARLQACVVFGHQRTATQDLEFALDQLVEIAARALSPGINDPFTAITCIDRLSSALARLAARGRVEGWHRDEAGVPRVLAHPLRFDAALDAAFNPIRQYACSNAPVAIRLMEALAELAAVCPEPDDRAALARHGDKLLRNATARFDDPADLADLRERYRHLHHPD